MIKKIGIVRLSTPSLFPDFSVPRLGSRPACHNVELKAAEDEYQEALAMSNAASAALSSARATVDSATLSLHQVRMLLERRVAALDQLRQQQKK